MAGSLSLSEFFEGAKYPKLVLTVGTILLLALQLAISIAVRNQSGLKAPVYVLDSAGTGSFSILGVGFTLVISMLILWLIPSILGDLAASFPGAVKDYSFFFVGVAMFVGGLLVWVIYPRCRLSKQMISNEMEIEEYRIEKWMLADPVDPDETRKQFPQPGERL